ncbi:MAG: hypothetical protein DRH70_02305 [Candidatus Coatesbacteria bacterium]|nr:MAG: hypothetical protein DRH70_02305 [Candidatus Coatesbacteria bacterium]
MRGSTFGIDIGHHLVKLVELHYVPRQRRVMADGYCIEISKDKVPGRTLLVRTLKHIFPRRMKRAAQSALGVYGGHNVVLKRIDLRGVPQGDVASAAEAEAKQYLPEDADGYITGFTTTNPVLNPSAEGSEVAFVGIREAICDFYDEVLMSSHKAPVQFEAAGLALAASYQRASLRSEDELIGILDIGEALTKIVLLKKGEFLFYEEMDIGCRFIISALQQRLGIALWPAVSLLSGHEAAGLAPEYAIKNVQSEISAFITRIKDLIWRARLNSQTWFFDRMLVCGGGAAIPCILDALSPLFRYGVTALNPFVGLPHRCRSLSKIPMPPASTLFAVAMGLALRARYVSTEYGSNSRSALPGHRRLLGH